jgi:DNA-directed RNA polymerase beta subunit
MQKKFSQTSGYEIDRELHRFSRGRKCKQQSLEDAKCLEQFFTSDPKNIEKFSEFKSRVAAEIMDKLGVTQHLLDPVDWFFYREAPRQISSFHKSWRIHVGNEIHVYSIVRVYIVPPTLPNIVSKIQSAARPQEVTSSSSDDSTLYTASGFAIPQLPKNVSSTTHTQQKMFLRANDARVSNTAYELQFLVDIVRFVYIPKFAEAEAEEKYMTTRAELAALKKKKTVPPNWQQQWKLVKTQIVGLRQPWHKFACPIMSFVDKRAHGTLRPDAWIYEEPSDQGGYLQCQNTPVSMPQNETLTHNTIHTFPVTKHRSKSETAQQQQSDGSSAAAAFAGNQESLDVVGMSYEERANKVKQASKRPQSVHLEIRCSHPILRCKSTSTIKHILLGVKSPYAQNLQNFVVHMQFLDKIVSPTIIFYALGETQLLNIPQWIQSAADPTHWYPETFMPILEKMMARHPMHIRTQEDAWIYISEFAGRKDCSRDKKLAHGQKIIQEDIYPNVGLNMECNAQKIFLHAHIIWRQMMASLGFVIFDDKDTYSRQRYDTNAQMFSTLLRNILGVIQSTGEHNLLNATIHHRVQMLKEEINALKKKPPPTHTTSFIDGSWSEKRAWKLPYFHWPVVFNEAKINEKIASVICRGSPWSISPKPGAARQSVTVAIGFRNWLSSQGSRARQNNTANKQQRRNNSARLLEATQCGYVCADQTPENDSFGVSRFQAQGSSIATTSSRFVLMGLLAHAFVENRDYIPITFSIVRRRPQSSSSSISASQSSASQSSAFQTQSWCDLLMIDGKFEWMLKDATVVFQLLQYWRRIGLVSPHISIYLQDRILYVNVAPGQAVRALLSLQSISKLLPYLNRILDNKNKSPLFALEKILGYQPVEWIRPDELRSLAIEINSNLWMYRRRVFGDVASHMEIEPSWLKGITAGCLPFSNHNLATRAVIGSNMIPQAFAASMNPFRMQQQAHILKYPQYPLVETRTLRDLDVREAAANGHNIIMCVTSRAFGEEDSNLMGSDSLAFGMLNSEIRKTYMTTVKPNLVLSFMLASQSTNTKLGKSLSNMFQHISHRRESFEVPDDRCLGKYDADYSKLEPDGLPKIGTILQAGDVIIGKVAYEVARNKPSVVYKKDESILMKDPIGTVVEVTTTQFGSFCVTKKVTIQYPCTPELGNKYQLRGGQKFTLALAVRGRDSLISLSTGRHADMYMNPIAYMARETWGIVKEQHRAQAAALMAQYMDGTCYNSERIKRDREIAEILYASGVEKMCYEPHLNGETGEITEPLLTAQVYASALIHLVSLKLHARGIGPVTLVTRQAVEGRSNNGALRWGAMEGDAAIANGLAYVNSDRNGSDQFSMAVCGTCNEEPYYSPETGYKFCKACKTGDNVKIIKSSFIDNVVFRKELPGIGVRASFLTSEMGDPWAGKAHLRTWDEYARSVSKESDTQLIPQPDPWMWKKYGLPEPETIGDRLDKMSHQNDREEKETLLWAERAYHHILKEQKKKAVRSRTTTTRPSKKK